MSQSVIEAINLLDIVKNEVCRTRHPGGRRLPTFYPSSASVELADGRVEGGCWRADWYRIKGVDPTNATEFYISMIHRLGKAVENVVVDSMKEAGVYESSGVKFYDPTINVSGELDITGRFRDKTSAKIRYFGVEVKSVYGQGATETISGRSRAYKGQLPFRPKPKTSNLLQVMTYLDQFGEHRGEKFFLEGFKLVYLPRDKPNDGREYTIVLVTKQTLKQGNMNDTEFAEAKAAMKDGERYALISTEGFHDYVETAFSLEALYKRWAEEKRLIDADTAPPRPFKKFYTEAEVEYLYSIDELSKTAYEDFKAGKGKPGHYLCQSYCEYRDFCYTRQGTPRKEADALGKQLVQIDEPAKEDK